MQMITSNSVVDKGGHQVIDVRVVDIFFLHYTVELFDKSF